MKRLLYSLLGMAVCASCTNDPDVATPSAGERLLRLRVADVEMATVPDDGSRTTFADDFVIKWEDEKDLVGVSMWNPSSGLERTCNVKGTIGRDTDGSAVVSATVNAFDDGDYLMAYYPYTPEPHNFWLTSVVVAESQTQYGLGNFNGSNNPMLAVPVQLRGTETDVAEQLHFRSVGALVEWGVYSSDEAYRSEKILSVAFTTEGNAVAGTRTFNIQKVVEDEDLDVALNTAGTSIDKNSITVSVIGDAPVPAAASPEQSVYAVMLPGTHTGDLVVTTDKAKYTWSDKTLDAQRSYVRRIGLNLAGENVVREEIVLSEVDLSAAGTANTYIVNKAATIYKFKATVKGNGVARSFTWKETDGTEITRGYTEAELAINPARVAVLWYNTPKQSYGWSHESPIAGNTVTLEDGVVSFATPDPFVSGNAVIAAYDDAGTILWSWNIWAVEGYDPDALTHNAGGYTMMDRNLGAMAGPEVMNNSDKREAAWAIGNYYQWGRKDPFPAGAEYDDGGFGENMFWGLPTYTPIAELAQDFSGTSWGASNMMFGSNAVANCHLLKSILGAGFTTEQGVAESVAYPYRWMSYENEDCAGSYYFWMLDYNNLSTSEQKGSWRYLWGAPEIGKVAGNDNLKTIYDPCPPGWKVAPAEAYSFVVGNLQNMQWGYYDESSGAYFPYTGQRQAGFGGSQLRSLTNGTMFLSSACVGENTLQKAYNGGVQTYNTYPGAGYNLRCVKEGNGVYELPHSGPRCLFIGNSITRTWNSYHPEFFTDNDFLGKGIDGQTSEQIKNRFYSDAIANDPVCVHIACGINDMANNDGANRTNEGIFANIREMAEMAASKGIKVIIGSTPPANYIWWLDEEWNAANDVAQRVIDLNVMLKAYAEERGFGYADYHSVLKDEENGLKKEYQVDAVHPNLEGFKVMESVFLPVFEQVTYNPDAVGSDGQLDDFDNEYWN